MYLRFRIYEIRFVDGVKNVLRFERLVTPKSYFVNPANFFKTPC